MNFANNKIHTQKFRLNVGDNVIYYCNLESLSHATASPISAVFRIYFLENKFSFYTFICYTWNTNGSVPWQNIFSLL